MTAQKVKQRKYVYKLYKVIWFSGIHPVIRSRLYDFRRIFIHNIREQLYTTILSHKHIARTLFVISTFI